MKIKTLLLLVALLLPHLSLANGPPKEPLLTDGVSAQHLGDALWREVRQRDMDSTGISQVQGVETGVLINASGDLWANFRMQELSMYGGLAIVVIFSLVVLFYFVRGQVPIEGGLSGNMVHRFTDYERIVHWTLAIVFLFLATTGLILLFGRPVLLPVVGKDFFGLLASASKEGHNLFGPLFLASVIMMLFSFARRNIYEKGDFTWLLKGGGMIGEGHASGGFFNMGEKTWYWMVMLIGLLISISGLFLVSPNFGQERTLMSIAHIIHTIGALILIAVSIGHMYLGSVGTEGSFEAMKNGYVDINWADAHHDRWGKVCHDEDLIIAADEYAKRVGQKPPESDDMAVAEQSK